jgi:hypothetical protein
LFACVGRNLGGAFLTTQLAEQRLMDQVYASL